ncbi:MAG TPA: ribbon-helix-helix protein, CopG family [Opitutaceae bacterium]
MPRTVISLEKDDKDWLDRQARAQRVPMTEIVRRAIRRYRQEADMHPDKDIHLLLEETRGLWRAGEGLAYQDRLREEWEART